MTCSQRRMCWLGWHWPVPGQTVVPRRSTLRPDCRPAFRRPACRLPKFRPHAMTTLCVGDVTCESFVLQIRQRKYPISRSVLNNNSYSSNNKGNAECGLHLEYRDHRTNSTNRCCRSLHFKKCLQALCSPFSRVRKKRFTFPNT